MLVDAKILTGPKVRKGAVAKHAAKAAAAAPAEKPTEEKKEGEAAA
jgi:hypothetical protein